MSDRSIGSLTSGIAISWVFNGYARVKGLRLRAGSYGFSNSIPEHRNYRGRAGSGFAGENLSSGGS